MHINPSHPRCRCDIFCHISVFSGLPRIPSKFLLKVSLYSYIQQRTTNSRIQEWNMIPIWKGHKNYSESRSRYENHMPQHNKDRQHRPQHPRRNKYVHQIHEPPEGCRALPFPFILAEARQSHGGQKKTAAVKFRVAAWRYAARQGHSTRITREGTSHYMSRVYILVHTREHEWVSECFRRGFRGGWYFPCGSARIRLFLLQECAERWASARSVRWANFLIARCANCLTSIILYALWFHGSRRD